MLPLAIEGGKPVRETLLPYGQQWIDEEDIAEVVRVLRGDYVTQGPTVTAFERAVAEYVGAEYAVAYCNGTAALHGACFAAGIGPGDEAITTPLTFLASSNCVLYMGGKPVFCDVDPETYNLDPTKLESLITERTKAIIPVDFTGQPPDMETIMDIARKRGLTVIEDAAHSFGARWNGRNVGTLADMTMFSFHPVKHITTGEGGVIVTNSREHYEKLQLFRNHGMIRDPDRLERHEGPWYYEMQALGFNYRMTDLQAGLGLSQLRKADRFIGRRREIAAAYTEAFAQTDSLIAPKQRGEAESSWHLYVLGFDMQRFRVDRRTLFEALRAENIGVNVHYIPVHLQPYYRSLGYAKGLCPNAERMYERIISLPLFPKMSDRDVNDVIEAVKKVVAFFKI